MYEVAITDTQCTTCALRAFPFLSLFHSRIHTMCSYYELKSWIAKGKQPTEIPRGTNLNKMSFHWKIKKDGTQKRQEIFEILFRLKLPGSFQNYIGNDMKWKRARELTESVLHKWFSSFHKLIAWLCFLMTPTHKKQWNLNQFKNHILFFKWRGIRSRKNWNKKRNKMI